jgi:hypothetical protein
MKLFRPCCHRNLTEHSQLPTGKYSIGYYFEQTPPPLFKASSSFSLRSNRKSPPKPNPMVTSVWWIWVAFVARMQCSSSYLWLKSSSILCWAFISRTSTFLQWRRKVQNIKTTYCCNYRGCSDTYKWANVLTTVPKCSATRSGTTLTLVFNKIRKSFWTCSSTHYRRNSNKPVSPTSWMMCTEVRRS